MHIPDNYLSPETCAVMTAVMVPVWAVSVKKAGKDIPAEKIPMLGVGAAFSFLSMMFNIPLPGGTTGHAVGGTLLAVALGPWEACISVSTALLLQALLFGDGGILSFGANCFNMAFVLPFTGYAAAKFITRHLKNENREVIGAAAGSYIGLNAAALCAAVEFGIQPLLFRDAAGNALYCPYGLSISVPAMLAGNLTLFGIAEIVFTAAVLIFVKKASPEFLVKDKSRTRTEPALKALLGALMILTPAGLLAEGCAWGEWDLSGGALPGGTALTAGLRRGFSFSAMLPDYSLAGVPEWFGYILSAVIGVAVLIIVFKLFSISGRKEKAAA